VNDFGTRVRKGLAAHGLSMRAAARALHYDVAYLSRVLSGNNKRHVNWPRHSTRSSAQNWQPRPVRLFLRDSLRFLLRRPRPAPGYGSGTRCGPSMVQRLHDSPALRKRPSSLSLEFPGGQRDLCLYLSLPAWDRFGGSSTGAEGKLSYPLQVLVTEVIFVR
jgi:hypothetical protein